jgi:hypothetical protein
MPCPEVDATFAHVMFFFDYIHSQSSRWMIQLIGCSLLMLNTFHLSLASADISMISFEIFFI